MGGGLNPFSSALLYRGINKNGSFSSYFIINRFSSLANQFCLYDDYKNIVVDDSLGDGEHDRACVPRVAADATFKCAQEFFLPGRRFKNH